MNLSRDVATVISHFRSGSVTVGSHQINETIKYTYDAGGNITQKIKYSYTTDEEPTGGTAINYQYGDSNWKDKLNSYNNKAITYDKIGNTTDYDGWKYTWEMGRQLGTAKGNGYDISYKYNDGGIRTQKTVNGVATKYHLVGDKVTFEENGTDKVYYTYDSLGDLVSMNLNGVEYYYIRNAQGDIIGLFDKAGTQVVSYVYDSWGKVISISGSLKDSVGVKNPYRYRGYRYDSETCLYYLQSRYYSPEWGRFINADDFIGIPGELLSCNMFAYCSNNPVNRDDQNGHFWGALAAGIGAVFAIPVEVAAVITVGVAILAALTIHAVVDMAVKDYKNHHVKYSDDSSSTNGDAETSSGEDIFGIPSSDPPTASQLRDHAKSKGWQKTKTQDGPEKWVDENGTPRITLKKGSPRTPGSEMSHVEIKDHTGQRVDRLGNPTSKRSPENHTPIKWDVND